MNNSIAKTATNYESEFEEIQKLYENNKANAKKEYDAYLKNTNIMQSQSQAAINANYEKLLKYLPEQQARLGLVGQGVADSMALQGYVAKANAINNINSSYGSQKNELWNNYLTNETSQSNNMINKTQSLLDKWYVRANEEELLKKQQGKELFDYLLNSAAYNTTDEYENMIKQYEPILSEYSDMYTKLLQDRIKTMKNNPTSLIADKEHTESLNNYMTTGSTEGIPTVSKEDLTFIRQEEINKEGDSTIYNRDGKRYVVNPERGAIDTTTIGSMDWKGLEKRLNTMGGYANNKRTKELYNLLVEVKNGKKSIKNGTTFDLDNTVGNNIVVYIDGKLYPLKKK